MQQLVVIVVGSLDRGGTEKQLLAVLRRLARRNVPIRVHTLIEGGDLAPNMRAAQVKVYEPPGAHWLRQLGPLGKFVLMTRSMAELWHTMAIEKPLVVNAYLPAAYLASSLCAIAARYRPLILSRRSQNAYQAKHPLMGWLERRLHVRVHLAVANSERGRHELLDEGLPASRCALIHNGIDLEHFFRRVGEDAGIRAGEGDKMAIACVANLIPYKGHADLLKAFAKLKQQSSRPLELVCIGRDDGTGPELAALAVSLGIDTDVRWVGSSDRVPAYLGRCQIGVLASHEEGFSNAVLEYMAAGLGIVATTAGGTPEQLEDGKSGLLVEPGSPDALAEALRSLVDDVDLRARLGGAARERVHDLFLLERTVAQYHDLLRCVLLNQVAGPWLTGRMEPPAADALGGDRRPWIPESLAPEFNLLSSLREDASCQRSLFLEAMRQGNSEFVSWALLFIHPDAETLRTALVEAVRSGHGAVARKLHERGAVLEELSPESERTLRSMKDEIDASDPLYAPSKFWNFLGSVSADYLRWGGERHFKQSINQSFFTFVPSNWRDPQIVCLLKRCLSAPAFSLFRYSMSPSVSEPPWYAAIDVYNTFGGAQSHKSRLYRILMSTFHHVVSRSEIRPLLEYLDEPKLGNPIRIETPDGKLISQDLVNSCREFAAIKQALPVLSFGDRYTIGELGAGYGRLGYVFLSCLDCRYFVFDIPPALHIAQWYLASIFPHKKTFFFQHFDDFAEIEGELANADIAFFTSNQLELFPDDYFHTFVNISSLHEMRRDQIDRFVTLMSEKTRYSIYSKQYRTYHNPYDGLDIIETDYRFPDDWKSVDNRIDAINPRFFESVMVRAPAYEAPPGVAHKPSVSILLSNYNHAKYLTESLDALCGQTRPADEIIIVDDGSTDDSVAIIEGYCERYPTIQFVRNDTNKGLMFSINRLMRIADTDYVVWASADDKLLPDFLEKSMAMLERHPGAGLCFSRLCVLEDATGQIRTCDESSEGKAFDLGTEPRFFTPQELDERLVKSYLWISGNTVVARRDAIIEVGGFHRGARWHADWMTFYIVALRYGAVSIPENLALIREHSATYSGAGMKQHHEQRRVLRSMISTLRNPAFRDIRKIVMRRPSLLSPFGNQMMFALIPCVRDWDVLRPFIGWSARAWWDARRSRLRRAVNASVNRMNAVRGRLRRLYKPPGDRPAANRENR